MSTLSVVLPAYNEEPVVHRACATLREILSNAGISYQLVLVDDGSRDGTWEAILRESREDEHIVGVHFSRNFGKEAAICAGLAQAEGDVTAVMDCDLQHPPEKLVEMYHLWEQGYEVIEGVKADRGKESFLYHVSAGFFYKIMSAVMGTDMQNASDFKMLDRRVVESILSMPERNLFFRAISSWTGYKTIQVPFQVQERQEGTSKWNSRSLIRYAFTNIVAFSTLPLQIVTIGGCLCFVFSLALGIYSLFQYFTGRAVEGYTTILIVLLLIGSAVMLSLGVIGFYIAKIYEEVKHRPRYLISRIIRGGKESPSSGDGKVEKDH